MMFTSAKDIPKNLFRSICRIVKTLDFDIALEEIKLRRENKFGFLLNPEARDWYRSSGRLRKLIFLFEALISEQERSKLLLNRPSLLLFTAGGTQIVHDYAQGKNLLAAYRETIMSAIANEALARFTGKVEIAVAENQPVELSVEVEVQECYKVLLDELSDQLILIYNIQRSKKMIDALVTPAEFDVALELMGRSIAFLWEPGAYFSFEELFDAAVRRGVLAFGTAEEQKAKKGIYDLQFQRWLETEKGFVFGNLKQYRGFLTSLCFLEFLLFEAIRNICATDGLVSSPTTTSSIIERQRLPVRVWGLVHVFLAMAGGRPVTENNKDELARTYGFKNGEKLIYWYNFYQDKQNRLELPEADRRAANFHLKRLETAREFASELNPDAGNLVQKELHEWNARYHAAFSRSRKR